MTAVRMTAAQLRRLGVSLGGAVPVDDAPVRRSGGRRTGYHTVCRDCAVQFTTMAAETRHLEATRHARYDWVLT